MTKRLQVRTTERDYVYEDKDFLENEIDMHFGGDGRGVGLLKIRDSEFKKYQFWESIDKSEKKVDIGNPNWSIYMRIFETAVEKTGFLNDTRSQTRIIAEIKFFSKEGDVMREDVYDWHAWHYSFHASRIPRT